jgi:hypothetical protein
MRWIVTVGTLVLVGLVIGLGLAGLFRAQAYLNHQAELHFEVQKGLPATKVGVTERGLRSPDSEPTQSVAGEIDRSVHPPAPDEATAISDVAGSTERNAPSAIQANEANRNAGEHTGRIGVSDLDEAEIAHQQNKGRVVPIQVIRAGAKPSVYLVPREQ